MRTPHTEAHTCAALRVISRKIAYGFVSLLLQMEHTHHFQSRLILPSAIQ